MKASFSFSLYILLFVLFASSFQIFAAGNQEHKNYLSDVEREAGSALTEEEKDIVDIVFVFYNAYYGYSVRNITPQQAAENMTSEEYTNTVRQAAKISKNSAAKGLQTTGKSGEKLLKALIITTENAAKAAGTWIDQKSKEYDERKK